MRTQKEMDEERGGAILEKMRDDANKTRSAKPSATKKDVSKPIYDYGNDRTSTPRSNYGNEGRGREMTKKQQAEYEIDSIRPNAEQTQKGLETATTMMGGAGLKGLSELAKKLAKPKLSKYTQEALPAPTKRLEYDKAGAMARKRSNRADMRREEMLKENAKRYGLDEGAPGYSAAADAVRKNLGGKDFALKKGGSVRNKPVVKKMASGGSVSSASKRGDGIATRGKTNCKMR
jgi:hypothetical protein